MMKIKEKIVAVLAACLLGCEPDNSPKSIPNLISADNPRLEQTAET